MADEQKKQENTKADSKSDSKAELNSIVQKQEAKSEQKMEKMVEQKIGSKLDKIVAKVEQIEKMEKIEGTKVEKIAKSEAKENKKWPLNLGKKGAALLTDEEKRKLFEKSQVSMWIESYHKIFSDFDPRSYSQRTISDDFLVEAKKMVKEKKDSFELNLLMSEKTRDKKDEIIIKKRLKEFFERQYSLALGKKRRITSQGALFVLVGLFVMIFTAFILFNFGDTNFSLVLLSVIGEPAGWFLFWEGLNILVFQLKTMVPEIEFAKKMAKCNVHFDSY